MRLEINRGKRVTNCLTTFWLASRIITYYNNTRSARDFYKSAGEYLIRQKLCRFSVCRLMSDESLITQWLNCEIKLLFKKCTVMRFSGCLLTDFDRKSGCRRILFKKDWHLKRTNFNRISLLTEVNRFCCKSLKCAKHKFNNVLLFVAGD